jgi:hypothetical protein
MNFDRRLVPAAGAVLAGAGLIATASPLHLIGAVAFVVGVAIVGLTAPDYALLAILVLFPVHPLAARVARFDFGVTGSALLVFSAWKEVALVTVLGSELVRHVSTHPDWQTIRARLQIVDVSAAALAALLVLGLALNPTSLALDQFRLWLFPVGAYAAVRLSRLSFRHFLEAAAVVAVAIGAFLIVQSSFLGVGFVLRYWANAGGAVPSSFLANILQGPRGAGTFASPNEAALAMAIWACMLTAAVLVLREWRLWHALALGVVLVALAFTFSRSGDVAAFVGIVALIVVVGRRGGLIRKRRMAWLLVAIIAASSISAGIYIQRGNISLIANTVLTAAGQSDVPDPSMGGHANSIDDALTLMETHPTGVGLGNVGARTDPITGESQPYIVESYYLTMGVTFGWIGLLWALLLPIAFGLCAARAIRRGMLLTGSALLGATLATAIVSILLPTMAEPQIAMLPWALAAFAAGPLLGERTGEPVPLDVDSR